MKTITTILLILFVAGFSSCELKKDLTGQSKPVKPGEETVDPAVTGMLDLRLNLNPETDTEETKSKAEVAATVDVNDFAIQIMDSTGKVVRSFDSYLEYRNAGELLLKEGVYTVHATWGKLYEAAFDAPYFVGDTVIRVEPGVVSSVKTDCTLRNAKVNIGYTDEFLKVFKDDYAAIITNGAGVLTLNREERRVAYMRSDAKIKLTISATTINGLDVVSKHKIENAQSNALYNVVLGIDMNVDSVIDQVKKPGITVDITMHDRDTIIEIEAPALPPDPDDEPNEPDNTVISITGNGLESPVEMTEAEALAGSVPVKVAIKAPAGLDKVVVKIIAPALEAVLGKENPFDLVNPSDAIKTILDGVGLRRPKAGDTDYTLDVTGMMELLGGAGTYKFDVKVTDKAGNSLPKTLTVIIK